jgi:hypothetical protein
MVMIRELQQLDFPDHLFEAVTNAAGFRRASSFDYS